jgi:hypothetical protein
MRKTSKVALASVVGLAGVFAVIGITANGGAPASDAPASVATQVVKPSHKPTAVSERTDLKSFTIDDRSIPGMADVWVKYSITNNSSKKSDYTFDWQAVNADGIRVESGTEYVTDVLPHQTVKGSDVTTLNSVHVKLSVTSFDRTPSFS